MVLCSEAVLRTDRISALLVGLFLIEHRHNSKKMKKYFFIILFTAFTGGLFAQQVPLFSQYYFNPLLYNPAMAGTGEKANAFLSHRNQWKNMSAAPQITTFTFDGPLKNKKIGLGAGFRSHSSGFIRETGVTTYYSYRVDISASSHMDFGLAAGVSDNRVDFSQAVVKDADDPFLLDGIQEKTSVVADAGIMYILKKTEIGLAASRLMGNSLEYANNNYSSAYQVSRNYLFSAKQTFYIDKENDISVFPLIIMRYTGNVPIQFDINAVVNWKGTAWLGIFYQSNYSAGANARFRIHDAVSIGYSYSMLTNSLGTSTGPSHEIMLGYSFNVPNKKEDDRIIQKQQQEIESISNKLQAVTDSLKKSHEAEAQDLKNQISALNLRIEQLKKDASDSSATLKLQITVLEEKLALLTKLIGN